MRTPAAARIRPLPPRTPGIWISPAKASTQGRNAPATIVAPAATAVSPVAVRQLRSVLARSGWEMAADVRPVMTAGSPIGVPYPWLRGDRQSGVGRVTMHGQLAELPDDRSENRDIEDRGLGQEHRVAAGLVAEQGHGEHVRVGQVVDREDHAAVAGEVLLAAPVLLHHGADARHQDDCRDPPPGWRVAAVGALAHLRSLSLFMWPVSRFARGGVEAGSDA